MSTDAPLATMTNKQLIEHAEKRFSIEVQKELIYRLKNIDTKQHNSLLYKQGKAYY
jgi:preprotein translocase subunit SecB